MRALELSICLLLLTLGSTEGIGCWTQHILAACWPRGLQERSQLATLYLLALTMLLPPMLDTFLEAPFSSCNLDTALLIAATDNRAL